MNPPGIRSFFLAAVLVPTLVFALDLSGNNLPYKDVRKGSPESVAISLLTSAGVLEGYSDGTFRPNQSLNRAEFLKIVLLSHSGTVIGATDSQDCFPDVKAVDWFSRYVCSAKTHKIVGGYPDGTFKPDNNVNYAEALKIMGGLYQYQLDSNGGQWFEPYYRAAQAHGTQLPVALDFETPLTRGQMARLAAAFLAESEGQLSSFRQAERIGGITTVSSSSSVASISSSSSVVSSSSVSSSSTVTTSLYDLPVKSAFLVTGRATPVADVLLPVQSEMVELRATKIVLRNEVPALQSIDIFTSSGVKLITLERRVTSDVDNYKQIFERYVASGVTGALLAPNATARLVVVANIRTPENNGASDQLLQMQSFVMTLHGKTSGITSTASFPSPFPPHQTTFGQITEVKRVGPANGQLTSGTGIILGSFSFSGSVYPGKTIAIKSLLFTPALASNVTVSQLMLASPQGGTAIPCSVSIDGITCAGITSELGGIGIAPRVLELHGNVSIQPGSVGGTLQVMLDQAGSTNALGSVTWTDGSGEFRWIALPGSPVAIGTLWQR